MRSYRWPLLFILASCAPPEFTRPLTPAASAVLDSALLGTWIEVGEGKPRLEISKKRGGVMTVHLPPFRGDAAQTFEGHVTVLGHLKLLNLRPTAGEIVGDHFLIVRYEVGADGALTVWVMREGTFRPAVQSGRLQGRATGSPSSLVITDTPANVTRHLQAQSAEDLWEVLARFRKG